MQVVRRVILVFIGCVLVSIGSVLSSMSAVARTGSDRSYARAENGVIAVLVERSSGQFRIEAAGGTPLLFRGGKGVTAYTNVHVGQTVWTSNVLHRPSPPSGTVAFPDFQIEELSDRVRLQCVLHDGTDSIRFTQEFVPSLDGDYAYVNIITGMHNLGDRPVRAGCQLMLDIMIGDADTVDLTMDGVAVSRERDWRAGDVPTMYEATATGSGYRVRGRLRGATADAPDRVIAGNWQFGGYLGTLAWDYTVSGLPLIDDAVALRWDDAALAPGASRLVRTDYGYLAFTDVELQCSVDTLGYNDDSTSYRPDPLALRATLRNRGSLPILAMDVMISLPSALTLAPGETGVKAVGGVLAPGAETTLTWWAHASPQPDSTQVSPRFEIIAPVALTRVCDAALVLPPLVTPDVVLDCGDTIRLALDPDGGGYVPDPFTISAVVRNRGNVPLRGGVGTLAVPAELVLLPPGTNIAVLPDPLLPGQSVQLEWRLRAILQDIPVRATYTIMLTAEGIAPVSCGNAVLLPPIIVEPCFESARSTAGTEFPIAFLPDVIGAAAEHLRIFIAAPERSHVRVTDPRDNTETVIDIPAGALRMVEVDATLNDYGPEQPLVRSVWVRSDHPVHVFTGNYRDRHSDGMSVLPMHALGTHYVTAGYNWSDAHEHFAVLATEDATAVTITPRAFTSTGRPDHVPFTITLDRGQIYYVKAFVAGAGGSLTGTRIEATKPVAVFSGAESGWIPETTDPNAGFLNPSADQMLPTRVLGTEYVAVPFRSRRNGDTYRIVATEARTTVTRTGRAPVLLATAGEWIEDNLSDVTHIAADRPVLVVQFANSASWDDPHNEYGDGSMCVLTPTDRHMRCHYFPAGMLEADVTLVANQAVSLDPGEWLQVPDTPALASPVFTAECWIRAWDSGTLISRSGGGEYWRLDFDRSRRRIGLFTGDSVHTDGAFTRDNQVSPGVWAHIALTVNAAVDTARVYIDGRLELETAIVPRVIPAGGGLAFGGMYDSSGAATFGGLLEECRYWSVARTPSQIRASMSARLPEEDRGLLAGYWSFCEGYRDETRFGHHLLPMGVIRLVEVFDLPAALNCIAQEDSNFVTIVVPEGGQGQVLLNFMPVDATAFEAVGGATWHVARVKVPTGMNRLETSDPRGLGAVTYGFAYHDAYTMNTGFRVQDTPAAISSVPAASDIVLEAPAPNPLHRAGTILYTLPRPGDVRLTLVDALGRTCTVLADGSHPAGEHRVVFDAAMLASGRYQLVLTALGQVRTQPVVIVR